MVSLSAASARSAAWAGVHGGVRRVLARPGIFLNTSSDNHDLAQLRSVADLLFGDRLSVGRIQPQKSWTQHKGNGADRREQKVPGHVLPRMRPFGLFYISNEYMIA